MKRKLWFMGSVFSMLLILAMWTLTLRDRAYNNCIRYFSASGGGTISTTDCSTLYGLGDDIVAESDSIEYVKSGASSWRQHYLPPIKFGWVLFIFAIFQWLLLSRKYQKKTKKTKQFAIAVQSTDIDNELRNEAQLDKKGGFVFDLKYFRLFAYIQIGFAVVIFIGNTLCVVISKNLKYILFSNGFAFESLQLNIEYIFPGVLFLTATLISVHCLQKYIKSCQSP